ncbi:hydantoinase B/oxoprolinase family protein [Bosea sp. (in: a-proteobacteria)]|uniref:hydantoinase B/oxoprolinase family protein n=1 Tax=Bosea sp. (in: a-proteobacteria) TaxID=1871050 RepID=UPI00260DC31C|nr:hydantoinase B/oxoprolinase family protein [Bosea sp. (in: a-proteobacteria)]MCO5089822.1 hydantoinase B/oxoprolinase family protein [Bosea sp. (in: a-proteobacteria)]
MAQSFNAIQIEILKNALTSIADEMALTILRTGHSTIIKDGADFSTALCDASGEMLAQGLTIPAHLGSIPDALKAVLAHFGEDFHPGDIVIQNDPYNGAMHLQDIFVFKPVFDKAGKLVCFACSIAHHTDVGGRVPGSNASDSTEIYQEGIRFPVLKLYEKGKPNQAVLDILAANVRVPDMVLGDLRATIAACHYGEREFLKLVERYGADRLPQLLADYIDYTERLTRAEIRALPEGTYHFEDWIDDDGIGDEPILLKVALTIKDGEVIADYTGSAPQVKGALNATLPFTKANTYLALRCVFEADLPNNGGFFRPIKVIAPEGTILNVRHPGACAARGLTGFRQADVVMGALAQAVPHKMMAAAEGGNTFVTIGGYDPQQGPFVHCDMIFGAWGGSQYRGDGDAMPMIPSNCTNIPMEIIEASYPLRFERYGFVPDTGGAGKSRGGLSIVRDVKLLRGEAILQVRSDRRKFMPWGLDGGKDGTMSLNVLNPDTGSEEVMPSKITRQIHAGDVYRHVTGGGGGYGSPCERDAGEVIEDIRQGKLTAAYCEREYGVVVRPGTLELDEAATRERRSKVSPREAAA